MESQPKQLLSRKEKKKLKLKLKRKEKRKTLAIQRAAEIGEENDIDEEKLERELEELRKKQEEEHNAWLERERKFQEELQKKKDDYERRQKEKQEAAEKRRQEREKKKQQEEAKNGPLEITTELLNYNFEKDPSFGTEKDSINCSFYLKTGSCRYADKCSKKHPVPKVSPTVLIRNLYDGTIEGENKDEQLEHENSEIQKHYEDFYEDFLSESKKYGDIVQFKVARNYAVHLRGNVYVQFSNVESAIKFFNAMNGRFYGGKQINPEFVPVTRWKVAICGHFDKNRCSRGKECNFLHVYKNPRGEFEEPEIQPKLEQREIHHDSRKERRSKRSRSYSRSRSRSRSRERSRKKERSRHSREHDREKDKDRKK